MAALVLLAQTSKIALSAATKKTLLQVQAPSNQRVKVLGWGVFFDGVSTTGQPVETRLIRNTTSGTMDGTSGTVTPMYPGSETIQSVATYAATAEPGAGDILDIATCHPQQGFEFRFPAGAEPIVPGGGRVAIDCTAPAAVNARVKLILEE